MWFYWIFQIRNNLSKTVTPAGFEPQTLARTLCKAGRLMFYLSRQGPYFETVDYFIFHWKDQRLYVTLWNRFLLALHVRTRCCGCLRSLRSIRFRKSLKASPRTFKNWTCFAINHRRLSRTSRQACWYLDERFFFATGNTYGQIRTLYHRPQD